MMKLKYLLDINPATEKLIKKIKCSTKSEIFDAVKRAKKASSLWAQLTLNERSKVMELAAKDFERESKRIGRIITDEMGKLYKSAVSETQAIAYGIRETIEQAKEALKIEKLREERLYNEYSKQRIKKNCT